MNILQHFRSYLPDVHIPNTTADRLRRAGYRDGEPQPRHRSHWANR